MGAEDHARRGDGLACQDCANPPRKGQRRCNDCRERHNARERGRREARKLARLCSVCGDKATEDESGEVLATCAVHREYFRRRAEDSYASARVTK